MNGTRGSRRLECAPSVIALIGTETERSDYYVYVWLDPRKPGKYKYGDHKFKYEPFYVGKGLNNRMFAFKREDGSSFLKRKLNNITCPICLKTKENLTEKEAFKEEIKMIALIGRYNLGKGPLTNLTDGGEGGSGHYHTSETKEKISRTVIASLPFSKKKRMRAAKKRRGVPLSPENKLKVSAGLLKIRDHLSEMKKGKPLSKEHRKKISKAMKGRPPTIGRTGIPHTEETKKKITEGLLRYYSQHKSPNKGKHLSEEHKEKIRSATKGRVVWNKGIKYSAEMMESIKNKKGEHYEQYFIGR
jgi:hypothetical protein